MFRHLVGQPVPDLKVGIGFDDKRFPGGLQEDGSLRLLILFFFAAPGLPLHEKIESFPA